MVLNARHRSVFIVVVGLVCLLLNYCWQYRNCCDVLDNVAKFKQVNEGFRPPVFFIPPGITSESVKLKSFSHTRKTAEEHNEAIKKNDSKNARKPTNLMIISQGRSGSSFLGQIFNQDPRVFFLYEPLLTIERVESIDTFIGVNTSEYNNLASRLLGEVFNCNWTNSAYLQYLSRPGHFRMSSRVLKSPPFCSKDVNKSTPKEIVDQNICTNLEASLLNKVCGNYTVKVVKILEHRIPARKLDNLEGFLESKEFDNKILYLVRDPRAFILSMWQMGWIAHVQDKHLVAYQPNSDRFRWYVKRICSQMEENIQFVQNPPEWSKGRVLLLRYEDLITDTENATKKLFEFVGLHIEPTIKNWLYAHMHSSNSTVGGIEDKYSLEKNSTLIMKKWRTEASMQMIGVIENQCKTVMDSIGYISTNGSSTVQYDLKTPLVRFI